MNVTDTTVSAGPVAAPERAAIAELGVAFKRMLGAVRRLRGRETHAQEGISNAQYQLLFGLREHERLSGGELALLAGLSPATTTQMLEALEAAGLVARERCSEDRRKVMTWLTDRGRALVAERHARFAPLWASALADFSDAELQAATAVMDKLQRLFEELASSPPS